MSRVKTELAADANPSQSPSAESAAEDVVRAALEPALGRHDGRRRRIERLDQRISAYSTSFTIRELDVTLDGGQRLSLILKDLSWSSLVGAAAAVRPRFLYDPRREIGVYEQLLADRGLGTATCFGSAVDGRLDRYWLFLEKVRLPKLCHVGSLAVWEQAARWLARMHGAFGGADTVAQLDRGVPLLRYDESFYRLWLERAQGFVAAGAHAGAAGSRFARVADRYDTVIELLTGMAQTLIHGEFYASNILVDDDEAAGAAPRICPVDWEVAAVGPGLMDVAALTSGQWSDGQRTAMVAAYHRGLIDAGVAAPALPELIRSLDACRLHAALQWIGWASDWTAPPDQARDWIAEALAAADRLGL